MGYPSYTFSSFYTSIDFMRLEMQQIKNLHVVVMGLGLHGGGLQTAIFFAKRGARVTVTDMKTEMELAPSVASLKASLPNLDNIELKLGGHDIEDFKRCDLVIKNPIVRMEGNKYLSEAKWIESDISVFLSLTYCPIIAVTGTKGKSFTSSSIHFSLSSLGVHSFLAGNIGKSPLSFLDDVTYETPVVLELSSWQLADLKSCPYFKPKVACITPIMPDHQNWYANMEDYVKDKSIIYKTQDKSDFLLLNYDDAWSRNMAKEAKSNIFWYSKEKLPLDLDGVFVDKDGNGVLRKGKDIVKLMEEPLLIKGIANKQNLLNAALTLYLMGLKEDKIIEVVKQFKGIEHRMEHFFTNSSGISFYNDSAATIPEATCIALKSFANPAILITGGTDKRLDFTVLAQNAHLAKKIFLLRGSATEKMIVSFNAFGIKYKGPYNNLNELLMSLKEDVEAKDNVVFSPASASFELFKNEFDRGNQFKTCVKELFG